MAKITIEIDLDNAAFDDAPMSEAARIIGKLARRIEREGAPCRGDTYREHDYNGNEVAILRVEA